MRRTAASFPTSPPSVAFYPSRTQSIPVYLSEADGTRFKYFRRDDSVELIGNCEKEGKCKVLLDKPPVSWRLGSGIKGVLGVNSGMQSSNSGEGEITAAQLPQSACSYSFLRGADRI